MQNILLLLTQLAQKSYACHDGSRMCNSGGKASSYKVHSCAGQTIFRRPQLSWQPTCLLSYILFAPFSSTFSFSSDMVSLAKNAAPCPDHAWFSYDLLILRPEAILHLLMFCSMCLHEAALCLWVVSAINASLVLKFHSLQLQAIASAEVAKAIQAHL